MSEYGRLLNCPNPWRPGNRVNLMGISDILNALQRDFGFRNNDEVRRWLKSEEVRPSWREFKRSYLAHNPVNLQTEQPFEESRNFEEPVFKPDLTMVEAGLRDRNNIARLRADSQRGDKSGWSVTDHIVWFCYGVYYRAWDNKSKKSLLRMIREPRRYDDGDSPHTSCGEFTYILVALIHIEVRQPDWVLEGEYETDEHEATYGAVGSLLLDQAEKHRTR